MVGWSAEENAPADRPFRLEELRGWPVRGTGRGCRKTNIPTILAESMKVGPLPLAAWRLTWGPSLFASVLTFCELRNSADSHTGRSPSPIARPKKYRRTKPWAW